MTRSFSAATFLTVLSGAWRDSFLRVAGAAALVAAPVGADVLTYMVDTTPLPPSAPSATIAVPKFNPLYGTLTAVSIGRLPGFKCDWGIENTGASPAVGLTFCDSGPFFLGHQTQVVLPSSTENFFSYACGSSLSLGPYDGVTDFGGASGTVRNEFGLGFPMDMPLTGAAMAPYIGAGTFNATFTLLATPFNNLPPALVTVVNNLSVYGRVRMTYTYTPNFTTLCLGDGTGGACPCANFGSLGNGCASVAYPGGARLTVAGLAGASPATDSLVLTATDIPGPTVFIQSNATGQTPFGDGILCATVGLIRLGVVFPTGGVASYPGGTTPAPIHIQGLVQSGDTKYYQSWYRSQPGLCSANNFRRFRLSCG